MTEADLNAVDLADPAEPLVDSAERLTASLLEKLAHQEIVVVSLAGLRGVSSSYFNVILDAVASAYGIKSIDDRLKFIFDSHAQQMVLERSMQSIRQEHVVA